jgi:hypothetical protein
VKVFMIILMGLRKWIQLINRWHLWILLMKLIVELNILKQLLHQIIKHNVVKIIMGQKVVQEVKYVHIYIFFHMLANNYPKKSWWMYKVKTKLKICLMQLTKSTKVHIHLLKTVMLTKLLNIFKIITNKFIQTDKIINYKDNLIYKIKK